MANYIVLHWTLGTKKEWKLLAEGSADDIQKFLDTNGGDKAEGYRVFAVEEYRVLSKEEPAFRVKR
ncbi:hypothetical protein LCGC14_0920920 [marine sediment metagenome]|uniref:Uncharacterized protein n=1 Tax=marine sediment metagenome TaxID=412755 RepID=A0A0F9RXG9_9ZZZZ